MREDFSYFQDHEFLSALEAYERMLDKGAEADLDAETLTDIAEYYAMSHRDEEANQCIDYAQSFYPDSVDPQIFLSRQQMFMGNQKEAWRICNQIIDQNDREVIFLRAELWLYEHQQEEAISLLYQVYKDCDEEEAPEFLYDSIVLVKDYDYITVSYDWCQELLRKYPDYQPGIVLYAEVLNAMQHYQETVNLLEQHIADMAYDSQGWLQMAEAQWGLGNLAEALEATDYALAINPDDADALLTQGCILYDYDQPEEGHKCLLHFMRFFPTEDRAVYMDAQCLFAMEQYDEAIRQFERLTNVNDPIYRGYSRSYLAYCYYRLENRERWLHYLRLASKEEYECLKDLFEDLFPGIPSKDYYQEAAKRK